MNGEQELAGRCSPDIVLLVHGTGAGDPFNDTGTRWWQRGSSFYERFAAALGEGFICQPSGQVFHWGVGPNSETARRQASRQLAGLLVEYERGGCRYHLVGHSHGGSVIWGALRLAYARLGRLEALGSWCTVGTPYLRFGPKRLHTSLAIPVLTAVTLAWNLYPQFRAAREVWPTLWSETPQYVLIVFCALWLSILLVAGLGAARVLRWITAVRESRREAAQTASAAGYCNQRWLGISSRSDEAINGLANTLNMSGPLTPRVPMASRWSLKRIIAAALNALFPPLGDEFIWTSVSRSLQGSDILGMELREVSSCPSRAFRPAALDSQVEAALIGAANHSAARSIAKFRDALGFAAVYGGGFQILAQNVRNTLSWDELVHTSYFDNDDLIRSIVGHIHRHRSGALAGTGAPRQYTDHPAHDDLVVRRRTRIPLLVHLSGSGLAAIAAAGLTFLFGTRIDPVTREYQIREASMAAPLAQVSTSDAEAAQQWFRAIARAPVLGAVRVRSGDERRLSPVWYRVITGSDGGVTILNVYQQAQSLSSEVRPLAMAAYVSRLLRNVTEPERGELWSIVDSAVLATSARARGVYTAGDDAETAGYTYAMIADEMLLGGDTRMAQIAIEKAVRMIHEGGTSDRELRAIITTLLGLGAVERAVEVANDTLPNQGPVNMDRMYRHIGAELARLGSEDLYALAERAGFPFRDPDWVLRAQMYARQGISDRVFSTLARLRSTALRDAAMPYIAEALIRAGKRQEAEDSATRNDLSNALWPYTALESLLRPATLHGSADRYFCFNFGPCRSLAGAIRVELAAARGDVMAVRIDDIWNAIHQGKGLTPAIQEHIDRALAAAALAEMRAGEFSRAVDWLSKIHGGELHRHPDIFHNIAEHAVTAGVHSQLIRGCAGKPDELRRRVAAGVGIALARQGKFRHALEVSRTERALASADEVAIDAEIVGTAFAGPAS